MPQRQEDSTTATFMTQITLYVIYKKEHRFRQMVSALGYNYSFQQYLTDMQHLGRFCGDLALAALSEAMNRQIYC